LPNAFLYDSRGARMVNLGRAGEASAGEAINNGNRVVGTVGFADNLKRAFRLGYGPLDERVDDSFFHPGIRASVALDINDQNEIVGNTYLPDGHGAFVYRNNEMVNLGKMLGSPGWARAINNDGLVAGESFLTADYSGALHAVVHDTRSGQTRDLGVLATEPRPYQPNSHAWDISESGLVVGSSHVDGAFGAEHAFLHDGTRMIDLGALPGTDHSDAYALNESGQIVGRSTHHAVLWDGGVIHDLNALTDGVPAGWQLAWANDINESGQIVGAVRDMSTINDIYHAFLLTPQPAAGGMTLASQVALDDVTQYTGQFSPAVNPVPLPEPVVPEPGAASLLLLAAAGAGMRRARRASRG
jgi:probable HAF family extracellular repeat protein